MVSDHMALQYNTKINSVIKGFTLAHQIGQVYSSQPVNRANNSFSTYTLYLNFCFGHYSLLYLESVVSLIK